MIHDIQNVDKPAYVAKCLTKGCTFVGAFHDRPALCGKDADNHSWNAGPGHEDYEPVLVSRSDAAKQLMPRNLWKLLQACSCGAKPGIWCERGAIHSERGEHA